MTSKSYGRVSSGEELEKGSKRYMLIIVFFLLGIFLYQLFSSYIKTYYHLSRANKYEHRIYVIRSAKLQTFLLHRECE